MLNRNTNSTCESSLGNTEPFCEPYVPSGLWICLDPCVWTTPGSWIWRGYIFTQSFLTDAFRTKVSKALDSSHQAVIGIQKGSKIIPSLAETRTRLNPPYKEGGTEISPILVGRNELEYSKTKSSLYVNLTISHSNWIELSHNLRWTKWEPVFNGFLLCR